MPVMIVPPPKKPRRRVTPAMRRTVAAVLTHVMERDPRHGEPTKRDLSEATGLPASSVANAVEALVELGVLTSTTVTRPHTYKPTFR